MQDKPDSPARSPRRFSRPHRDSLRNSVYREWQNPELARDEELRGRAPDARARSRIQYTLNRGSGRCRSWTPYSLWTVCPVRLSTKIGLQTRPRGKGQRLELRSSHFDIQVDYEAGNQSERALRGGEPEPVDALIQNRTDDAQNAIRQTGP